METIPLNQFLLFVFGFFFLFFLFCFLFFRLNQSYPPEYVKAEITKNKTLWIVNKTAQALLPPFYWFPQPFIEFAMINITVRLKSPIWITRV